jgi:serine/threonine protein kinase
MTNCKHPVRDPFVGTTINERFYLHRVVGRGATCSVYEATDSKDDRTVAVKLMHAHLVSEKSLVSRFMQEAKNAQLLQHPNIVKVEETNVSENGVPYLIVEFVDGSSLHDVIKGAGWIPTKRAFVIFDQVCAALSYAHEKAIVHGDLKPSNIMLVTTDSDEPLVKILDFGISKQVSLETDSPDLHLTQAAEALGSLLYMSPEQCLGQEIDNRSDCYSLGCVMYETLTGKPPFRAASAFETMNKQINEMPEPLNHVQPNLDCPSGLQDVVFKALSKKTSDRYQEIAELQKELKTVSAQTYVPHDEIAIVPQNSVLALKGDSKPDNENLPLAKPWIITDVHKRQLVFQLNNQRDLGLFVIGLIVVVSGTCIVIMTMSTPPFMLLLGFVVAVNAGLLIKVLKALPIERKALMNRVGAIEENEPTEVLITKILPKVAYQSMYTQMTIEFTRTAGAKTESLIITPFVPSAHIWPSLCTASQLEVVTLQQTFPIPALLFRNRVEEPIAVHIIDQLAWIVTT